MVNHLSPMSGHNSLYMTVYMYARNIKSRKRYITCLQVGLSHMTMEKIKLARNLSSNYMCSLITMICRIDRTSFSTWISILSLLAF